MKTNFIKIRDLMIKNSFDLNMYKKLQYSNNTIPSKKQFPYEIRQLLI